MATERAYPQEKESRWSKKLFWGGVAAAIVGAAVGVAELAAVGVLIAGIGWAAWKGNK